MINVWFHDLGAVVLDDQFVAEAKAKWPGEIVTGGDSILEFICGIPKRTEPAWQVHVSKPLDSLMQAAFVSGFNIRRLKSIAALVDWENR